MKRFLLLTAACLWLGSCASSDCDITGSSWKLTEIIAENSAELISPEQMIQDTDMGSPITISFTDTQATGTAGVNNFFSLVKIEDDKLTVSNVGATRKAGSPDMMNLEQHFFATLIQADHFSIKKDRLTISDKNGKALLIFDLNKLENTRWTLLSLNDGTALVSVPQDFSADISFGKDNSVAGSNGVNRYFGSYTIGEKNTISFSQMGTTMMAGPEEWMTLADRFQTLLAEVTEYSLSGSTLSFRNADKALVMTFTAQAESVEATESEDEAAAENGEN